MNHLKHKLLFLFLLAFCSHSYSQTPVLSYSFESGMAQDDSALYLASLQNNAQIVTTSDGNHVLSTGATKGYLDMGVTAGKTILSQLSGNYTISVDFLVSTDNSLASYSWLWALTNGIGQYMGLINAAGNGNWFYEIKNSTSATRVASGAGVSTAIWHNISIVQNGNICTFYLDGTALKSTNITLKPTQIAASLSGCYIGKSPFNGDAYMKNTLIDNFKIFNLALTSTQIKLLFAGRPNSATTVLSADNILETNRKDLYVAQGAQYIHNTLTLPTTCTYGTITWKYNPFPATGDGVVSYNNGTFNVTSRGKTATTVGTLQGTITYSGNTYDLYKTPLTVKVAPDDNAYGYLYCHMPNLVPEPGVGTLVSQCITFALGTQKDKGLIYTELNRGSSIINGIGTTLPWCRDAFIAKDTLRHCYYMVTTDLYGSLDNGTSMLMNYSVGMFKSYDLINWTYSRCDIKNYLKQNPVTNIYNNAATALLTHDKVTRVWAPQIIFINNDPYIYYAVGSSDNGNCDHFFISKANDNFTGIDSFKMLYGNNTVENVLDADIVFLETDSLYHMYMRDYASDYMCDITTKDLLNPWWSAPLTTYTDGGGYEASSVFRRINEDVWNVGNVNYASNVGFHFRTADACLRNFKAAPDLTGHVSPQHGSFIHINKTEYDLLQVWSDLKGLIADATELNNTVNSSSLAALLVKVTSDISKDHTSAIDLNNLYNVLKNDFETLSARYNFENAKNQAYNANLSNLTSCVGKMDSKFNNGTLAIAIENAKSYDNSTDNAALTNVTANLINATKNYFLTLKSKGTAIPIVNGTFTSGNLGWNNTSTSVAFGNSNGVSEYFALRTTNHTVNLTQTLNNLANGYYLIKSQAFERNGANDYTGRDFKTGVEKINFSMIGNEQSIKIKSLYSIPYTGANSLNGFADGTLAANTLFTANSENFANYMLVYVSNGTLTFGLQKPNTTVTSSNWTCFDNFQVYSLGSDVNSALTSVTNDNVWADKTIYNLLGMVVSKTSHEGYLSRNITPGIYIIAGKKLLLNGSLITGL